MSPWRWLLFFLPQTLAAQPTQGGLTGIVLDPSRHPIPGAEVTVGDIQRAATRRAYTDRSGEYRISGLTPSIYRISASKSSFETLSASPITVEVDSIRRVDFTLPLAGLKQSIEVTASPLQTEASDSGVVIGRSRIEKLPLNRRGFLQLAPLTPGVLPPVQDSELSSRGSFAMHANGAREEYNNYLLDGVDNNDQYNNRFLLEPAVDTIQEFKIATGAYSAEYARSGGAQVNVITRGGSNGLHGALYEYFRNQALDAGNYFDAGSPARFQRNQYGAVLGGPVSAGRTFFFASFDGLQERRGFSRLGTTPILTQRSGDLSLGAPVIDPFTQRPFPANRIPADRISRVGRLMLDLFPLPNLGGLSGNYLAQPVLSEDFAQGSGRLDHRTARDVFTLRYNYGRQDLFEPFAEESTDLPGFGDLVYNSGHNALAHWQRSFSPRLINSVRLGFNRGTRQAQPENVNVDAGRLWGVSWLNVSPRDFGFPAMNVQGYSFAGDATQLPITRYTATYQVYEDVSFTAGSHSWKAGFQARNFRANGFIDLYARGSLTFSGQISGTGLSDLLLGFPSFGLQAQLDNQQTQRSSAFNAYIQDDRRITPRLSLNLGLRYEFNTPATDPYDRLAVFDPVRRRVIRAGTDGVSRSGIQPDRNNFAPRAGLAYSPRPDLVLRAGYGVYFDASMLELASAQYFNPPFFSLRLYFPTQTSLLTVNDPFPRGGGIAPPVSPSTLDPALSTAYLQHWSLSVQKQVTSSTVATVSYAGSKGAHLMRSRDWNQAAPGPGDVALRRPIPGFGGIFAIESAGSSIYHALQAGVDRRLARGLALTGAYTWSKSIDDASAFLSTKADKNFPQDSRNYRAERAAASFDMRHRLAVSAVYNLPGHAWWSRNFELSAIAVAQSGQPFTPLLRFDNSNTGNTGGNLGSDRPDVLRDPRLDRRTPEQWFDVAAFRVPSRFTFGSAGRNIVRGPGLTALDVSLLRRFRLSERLSLSIEAQAFNLLNRVNFDLPERYVDEPATLGRIFSAKAPRQLQFTARLTF